jgi:hypothetical protein
MDSLVESVFSTGWTCSKADGLVAKLLVGTYSPQHAPHTSTWHSKHARIAMCSPHASLVKHQTRWQTLHAGERISEWHSRHR